MFVYSECVGEFRWVFQAPKSTSKCTIKTPTAPKRIKYFSCKQGQYLDAMTNNCTECSAGTYSLGGGVLFDNFKKIPDGFDVDTFSDDISLSEAKGAELCKNYGWTTKNNKLVVITGKCSTILTLTVDLVKDGSVSFKYSFTDSSVFFNFEVQSDRCSNIKDNNNSWIHQTEKGDINSHVVNLKRGRNLLSWNVYRAELAGHQSDTETVVSIYQIQIEGLAFVHQCFNCRPGYYSHPGSTRCQICPKNTFSSAEGAAKCENCNNLQFSDPGSSICQSRPNCNVNDYQKSVSNCVNNKFKEVYTWIKPQICVKNSLGLPTSDEERHCKLCNPGQRELNGKCDFCPENQYSADTNGICKSCGVNTQVIKEYVIKNWFTVPQNLSLSCMSLEIGEDSCPQEGWLLNGDHVRSAPMSNFNNYRFLTLHFSGLLSPRSGVFDSRDLREGRIVYGKFVIELEVFCTTGFTCRMFILKHTKTSGEVKLQEWNGEVKRHIYTYEITEKSPVSFTLLFDQTDNTETHDSVKAKGDHVKIYSISVSNVIESGGIKCQPCPLGEKDSKCIPCPKGHFFDKQNGTCMSCPIGTYVANFPAEGRESCKPCPKGLSPLNGASCGFDYTPLVGKHTFDYTPFVKGFHLVKGSLLFTTRGTRYYHMYNISLDTSGDISKAFCSSNTSRSSNPNGIQDIFVNSYICRFSMIPSTDQHQKMISALPISLGDRILNASSGIENPYMKKHLTEAGFDLEDSAVAIKHNFDYHIFARTEYTTSACPNGRTSVLTLRCDPHNERLQLPPNCADGTCNGCLFMFLWTSPNACPICKLEDFTVMKGECLWGKQDVNHIPPSYCVKNGKPMSIIVTNKKCPFVSKPLAAILLATIVTGLCSLILACYCHRKNKSLEYKYMQLVDNKDPSAELPGVESCAVNEGDEEDFEGHVTIKASGPSILSKFRKNRSNDKMEHLNLADNMDA